MIYIYIFKIVNFTNMQALPHKITYIDIDIYLYMYIWINNVFVHLNICQ